MNKLLEAYAPRIEVAEKVYSRDHAGEELSMEKKVALATIN